MLFRSDGEREMEREGWGGRDGEAGRMTKTLDSDEPKVFIHIAGISHISLPVKSKFRF